MKSRFQPTRKALLFWVLFIGLGAVAGAAGMLADPTGRAMGMDAMLPFFQVFPFADVLFRSFTFSGIALLLVNGLPNLLAAGLLLRRRPSGVLPSAHPSGCLACVARCAPSASRPQAR